MQSILQSSTAEERKMSEITSSDKPAWIHPEQAMQMHRIKMKKKALQARMNKSKVGRDKPSLNITTIKSPSKLEINMAQKRKNPFLKDEVNKKSKDDILHDLDTSTDSVLFELMKIKPPECNKNPLSKPNSTLLSFNDFLSHINVNDTEVVSTSYDTSLSKGESYIPIDWTLNTKMRIMSLKPFAWNGNLKTSEQASGTTGFVRCLNTGSEQQTTLDTSPNARFHQCCLVWQHPSLPWIELFPRSAGKVSATLAINSVVANNQFIKDALFSEWSESFRSLFHLLRARQCPYFYVCANTFTVLFRAAGICGISEVHALLTPTTRGFRQSLKQQEIEFTMPLKFKGKRRSDNTIDSGYDTIDSNICNTQPYTSNNSSLKNNLEKEKKNNCSINDYRHNNSNDDDNDDDYDDDDDDDDDGFNYDDDDYAHDNLLESLGIEVSEINKINKIQKQIALDKESKVDKLKQSLVFVKGIEAQALFNFLINCKSAVATTGSLAGIPPTILAPVAFHGATLKSLKVRENIVRIDNEKFHSLEIKGPILPNILPSLCFLMKSSQLEQFSISCAQLNSTKSFTDAKQGLDPSDEKENEKKLQSVFGQENLSDCGFNNQLLSHFCNSDSTRIQFIENLKYSNEGYIWS